MLPVSSPHFSVHPHPHSGSCRVAQVSHWCQWVRGFPLLQIPLLFGGCFPETPFPDAERHLHCEEAIANCKQSPKSRGEGLVPCPLLLSEVVLATPPPHGDCVTVHVLVHLKQMAPAFVPSAQVPSLKRHLQPVAPRDISSVPSGRSQAVVSWFSDRGGKQSLLSLLRSP